MFRLFRLTFRAIVLAQLLSLAFSAGMGTAYLLQLRRQYRSWGQYHGERERPMRGDDLVAQADLVETRSVDIDAAPDAVWPWLAQLGYGRGGWYSFPVLDRPWAPTGGPVRSSADAILPEFGDLAEGDLVPTQSGAGFEARIVAPAEALVLYLDDGMVREQLSQADDVAFELPENVPPYQVSFAYELEPLPGDRSRLTARLRVHLEASEQQWRMRPFLALALFAFMRGQLLGIRRRVEGREAD